MGSKVELTVECLYTDIDLVEISRKDRSDIDDMEET